LEIGIRRPAAGGREKEKEKKGKGCEVCGVGKRKKMGNVEIHIGAEERALLLVSGVRAGAGAAEALAAVSNWERFLWLVNEHGVAGFVKRNLAETGMSGLVPSTVFQRLRNQAFKSIARNAFIMTALDEATVVLNGAGIVPVLLKGTALEKREYGNSGLRPMTDADVLLPADECLRGWRVLQAAGFEPLPFKSPLYKLIPMHVGKHLPSLIKGGFSLEIHHSLFWAAGVRRPASGGKGDAAAPQHDGGMKYKVLPAGMHFLYLVSHLSKHELNCESQLRLYNDLAVVL
jgi:hypothetical protein